MVGRYDAVDSLEEVLKSISSRAERSGWERGVVVSRDELMTILQTLAAYDYEGGHDAATIEDYFPETKGYH